MAEVVPGPPWPARPFVVDLDELGDVTDAELALLERRGPLSVGVLRGDARGTRLLAALAVDLLVAAPGARLGDSGPQGPMVLRRARGIAGLRVAMYLAGTSRMVAAERARAWGLVNDIHDDPAAAAIGLVDAIAERSPVAVAAILRLGRRGAMRDWVTGAVVGSG